jgi:cytochrome b pre-mRNA-processing protein 3
MDNKYINIYNNLVNLTRNKELYKNFANQDEFSDRLIFFLFHFAFFLKVFKSSDNKKQLQDIFDYVFRQLELSIREIGYGDQSVNKKMKVYLNIFYDIIDKIDDWEELTVIHRVNIFKKFINSGTEDTFLGEYFEKYRKNLLNNTFNSYIKGVVNL